MPDVIFLFQQLDFCARLCKSSFGMEIIQLLLGLSATLKPHMICFTFKI